jgi:MHS family proline/betaine transporter-like MFS transporter
MNSTSGHSIGTYSKVITSSIVGNLLEWFDFALYGYMAPFIAPKFFPNESKLAATLSVFAVFAVGYLARPIGALVLGRVGDKIGRRALLYISIMILGLSSCAIGLLPTYETIGVFAPILLVLLRLAQGFSVGGEYTGSMTYTSEFSMRKMRGFISSFATTGTMLGILLASGAAWGTRMVLGDEVLADWGWRVPFLFGIIVAFFGVMIRRHIPETKDIHSESYVSTSEKSILIVLKKYWKEMAKIICIVTGANVALYIVFVYAVDFSISRLGSSNVEIMNSIGLAITIPTTILGGWLSDKYGRRKISIITNGIIILLAIPVLYMCLFFDSGFLNLNIGFQYIFLTGQVLMAIPIGLVLGVQGAMVAELLPKDVRCTVFSVAYSLAMALFAGTSPMVAAWMIHLTNNALLPALYIIFWVFLAVVSVVRSPETVGKEIN